ncbi:hypothetical protein ElyMa_005603200 [Elysia marginata]|uniref:Uncharacterized protein n=1 Tax=Elysia marginata TaxID=1093978 RepID=A0AAV4F4C4_9GAST|nr:hypothetical protein ElyMa_005603200 [Elysia marginata]
MAPRLPPLTTPFWETEPVPDPERERGSLSTLHERPLPPNTPQHTSTFRRPRAPPPPAPRVPLRAGGLASAVPTPRTHPGTGHLGGGGPDVPPTCRTSAGVQTTRVLFTFCMAAVFGALTSGNITKQDNRSPRATVETLTDNLKNPTSLCMPFSQTHPKHITKGHIQPEAHSITANRTTWTKQEERRRSRPPGAPNTQHYNRG